MTSEFGACCSLPRTLQTNEHDDIWLALLWLERFSMGVNELDEFIEDSLLYEALLVDGWWEVFEVDCGFYGFAECGYELDVDICFEEGVAYLFDHAIESLPKRLAS